MPSASWGTPRTTQDNQAVPVSNQYISTMHSTRTAGQPILGNPLYIISVNRALTTVQKSSNKFVFSLALH